MGGVCGLECRIWLSFLPMNAMSFMSPEPSRLSKPRNGGGDGSPRAFDAAHAIVWAWNWRSIFLVPGPLALGFQQSAVAQVWIRLRTHVGQVSDHSKWVHFVGFMGGL